MGLLAALCMLLLVIQFDSLRRAAINLGVTIGLLVFGSCSGFIPLYLIAGLVENEL